MGNEATSIRNVDDDVGMLNKILNIFFVLAGDVFCFVKSHFSQLWRFVLGAILLVQRRASSRALQTRTAICVRFDSPIVRTVLSLADSR